MGRKRKFGALDVVIILVIIAIVVVAVKFFATDSDGAGSSSGDTVHFTVEISNVPANYLEGIAEGDEVYDAKVGGYLGTVVDAELVTATAIVYDPNTNTNREVDVEDTQNARITVEAQAEISDRNTSVSGNDIMVGTELSLRSNNFAGSGYCIILEEK